MFLSNRRPNNWVSFAENSKQAHIAKAFGSSASVVFASVIVKLDKVENVQQNIGVFYSSQHKMSYLRYKSVKENPDLKFHK